MELLVPGMYPTSFFPSNTSIGNKWVYHEPRVSMNQQSSTITLSWLDRDELINVDAPGCGTSVVRGPTGHKQEGFHPGVQLYHVSLSN